MHGGGATRPFRSKDKNGSSRSEGKNPYIRLYM